MTKERKMHQRKKMTKAMIIMLACVGIVFGGIFGLQLFRAHMTHKYLSHQKQPPMTVTTTVATLQPWQTQIKSVGSLRALRGVSVTTEVPGLIQTIHFDSGVDVETDQLLLQLNANVDLAQLQSLEANAALSTTVYERDKAQYAIAAISQATLDADAASLKSSIALVEQQQALLDKKTIRAPFAGRLGITTVQPGQYLNPGDAIVTLQQINPIYVDFTIPQQYLPQVTVGTPIALTADPYPDQLFKGTVHAIDPRVSTDTRNISIEGLLENNTAPFELLPGMFVSIKLDIGQPVPYLTVPQTAISFNPYGATVFIVEENKESTESKESKESKENKENKENKESKENKENKESKESKESKENKDKQGKPILTVRQSFVETGETRGDQIAILSGLKANDTVVTSGQLKLQNGSEIVVNNTVQPLDNPSPKPVDR